MIPREAAWLPSLVFVALPLPGPAPDRLGLRPLAAAATAPALAFRVLGRLAIIPVALLLRPGRLPRAIHLLGGRREPLRAACLPAPGAVPGYVIRGATDTGPTRSRGFPCGGTPPAVALPDPGVVIRYVPL